MTNWKDPESVREYHREYMRERRSESPTKIRDRHRDWARVRDVERPAYPMWNRRKTQAAKAGISFSIRPADIEAVWPIDNLCPVLGVKMERLKAYAPSLDRFDSEIGYTPENIRVISRRANRIKNDGSAAEHRAIAAYQDGLIPQHFTCPLGLDAA